jgi:hypothetical protein
MENKKPQPSPKTTKKTGKEQTSKEKGQMV